MSGRYLFDTNAIINAINRKLVLPDGEYHLSVISEIELFSFPKLTQFESEELRILLSNFEIVQINEKIKNATVSIRRQYGLRVPDSIICASAQVESCSLITDDKALFRVEGLDVMTLESFLQNGEI